MLKKIFYMLAVIGAIIIAILAFKVPKDPFQMVPSAMFHDKPLWLCLIITGNFFYFLLLGFIYNKLEIHWEED